MSNEILTTNNDLPHERRIATPDIEKAAKSLINQSKKLFKTKFPLISQVRMGTEIQTNEVLSDNFGAFNLLYFPFDEKRKDKEEQVKISNDKQRITVIIKCDKDNPEISFELFELNEGSLERKIASETNTLEAIYRANKILGNLSVINKFDLVYTALDL